MATSKEFSKLTVVLEAESSRLQKELDKVNNRMGRWERRTKSSVTSVKSAFVALGAVIGSAKALGGVVSVAVEFERLKATLEGVTGSTNAAKAALGFIRDFATSTPFQVKDLTNTFIKLKSFGLAPTYEVMQALTDQASKLGGSQETLNGVVLAVGQAWAKQKLQGEEILQLVERGVPVWDLLTKATGKTAVELQELSEKGELGRETIAKLIEEMGKASFGAATRQVNTLGGALSNFGDTVDTIIDKFANERTGFSAVVARTVNGVALAMRQLAGTESIDDVKLRLDSVTQSLFKIQKQILDNMKSGSPIPDGWTIQAQYYQAQVKKVTEELRTLEAEAKKREEDLKKATGSVDVGADVESKAERMARERAAAKAQREKEQLEKELDAVRRTTLDAETIEAESWWKRQAIVDKALDSKLISESKYAALSEQLEKKHLQNLSDIQKDGLSKQHQQWISGWQGKLNVVSGVLGQVSNLMQSENQKQFEIGKKAAIANTIINTYQMAVSAYNALASIPYVGPALGAAAAAAAVAFGVSQVQAIKSQSFQGGGTPTVSVTQSNPNTGLPTGTPGGAIPDQYYQDSYATGNTEPLVINVNTYDGTGFERLLRNNRGTLVQLVRDAQTARGQRATV